MPVDRFIHPRLGHSDKVTLLTDFEYRVWTQYLMSADDFGVMRCSAVTLQSDNDALHAKRPVVVQRALEHLISVELILQFEHQHRLYVYQPDWQKWQKIEWPRATIQPRPDEAALALCPASTRRLFRKHPGGNAWKDSKDTTDLGSTSQMDPKCSPSDLGSVSQMDPKAEQSLARVRVRETAKANGFGS